MEISLNHMKKGQKGVITRIRDRGSFNRRIRDMGVIPGVEVCIENTAPLGDPIGIKARGVSLAVRNNEAAKIYVEVALCK